MSTVKVYGSIFSTCTQRVLVTLEEAGATYELIDVSMQAGQHKVWFKTWYLQKKLEYSISSLTCVSRTPLTWPKSTRSQRFLPMRMSLLNYSNLGPSAATWQSDTHRMSVYLAQSWGWHSWSKRQVWNTRTSIRQLKGWRTRRSLKGSEMLINIVTITY